MSLAPPTTATTTSTASKEALEPGVTVTNDGKYLIDAHTFVGFLREAGHVRLELSQAPKGERGALLTLAMAGASVQASVPTGFMMEPSAFQALRAQPGRLRSRFAKYRKLENPSVEELKKYGLPLYWNEEWLREKVDECRTFAEVSRTYAEEALGVNATTIANYARDTFDWRMREETTKKRALAMAEYEKAGGADAKDLTQAKLAETYDVSMSTINRWITGTHEAYAMMLKQHAALERDPKARTDFLAEYGVEEGMLARWLSHGSEVFNQPRVKQGKSHYYPKAKYAVKRELARQNYLEHDGRVDKSALARELEVDRSTVTSWINSFDAETLLDQ